MSKSKLILAILAVLLLLIYPLTTWYGGSRNKLVAGEVRLKEVQIKELSQDLQSLIYNYYQPKNDVYLITDPDGPVNEPFPIIIYSSLLRGKNLYVYPKATAKRDSGTVRVYINEEPAANDDQVKVEIALLLETTPPPDRIEVYYNGKRIKPATRMFSMRNRILKSDLK